MQAQIGRFERRVTSSWRRTAAPPNRRHLLVCGERWHGAGDPGAGWELIYALRSRDPEARAIATRLLTKTKDLQFVNSGQNALCPESACLGRDPSRSARPQRSEVNMNTPYGIEIVENCLACRLRRPEEFFCNVSLAVLKAISSIGHQCTYPGGAVLFVEGQIPRGAFMLCHGRVKLSTTSRDGKVLILKIAQPGDVLGLSAVISGNSYELTAETSEPCQVNFLERESLLRLIGAHGELGLRSAQAVSREFQSAYRDIHDLVLARSSAGKLARLLLSWTNGQKPNQEIRIRSGLTHEEMAQMIGSSRETVTRLLSDLKKKELIRLEGAVLVIRNKPALEALAA